MSHPAPTTFHWQIMPWVNRSVECLADAFGAQVNVDRGRTRSLRLNESGVKLIPALISAGELESSASRRG